MEDLKVVFYIVVAIIWVVVNNYKKISQASKQRNPSQPDKAVIHENWPKVEMPRETMVNKRSQNVDREKVQSSRKSLVRQTIEARAPIVRESTILKSRKKGTFLSTQEGGTTKPSLFVHFEENSNVDESPNRLIEGIRNADMQQAVILSEVLKRPYN